MKVRASIKRLCEACRIVKRRGKLFVVCKDNRKVRQARNTPYCTCATPSLNTLCVCLRRVQHKQRQGYATMAGEGTDLPSAAAAALAGPRSWLDAGASVGASLWKQA